jgi:hypothetical protein
MLVGVVSFGEAGAYACESGNLRLGSSGGTPQLGEQRLDAWVDVPSEVLDCAKTSELGAT